MTMKRIALLVILPLCLIAAFGGLTYPQRITVEEFRNQVSTIYEPDPSKGEILFHLGGCGDCHLNRNPESPNFNLLTGGEALPTPVGKFYPPNITPDSSTGIGSWSDLDFINAMVRGISPEGKHYSPSFPYTSYSKASYEDLLDIKAYIFSLNGVSEETNPHDLIFPFNFSITNLPWKMLFLESPGFEYNAEKSEEWNRGAYLVNGLGHCGSCHTPRNLLFAEKTGQQFQGAPPIKSGEKEAPGIAGLDRNEILNALDEWSGAVSETSVMYLVTQAYSNYASFEDLEAIATYLSDLNPQNEE